MKKTPLIPFGLNPRHWALRGQQREFAEAHYTLTGEELERRILEITYQGILTPIDTKDFKLKKLGLDLKYAHIQKIDYDKAVAEIEYPNKKSPEYKKAILEVRYEHGELEQIDYDKALVELQYKDKTSAEYQIAIANIERSHGILSERDYAKTIATIRHEPWVSIVNAAIDYNAESGNGFNFELDWNQAFVEDLIRNGWHGPSQEDIVDQWFTQTCQDVFNSDPDFFDPEATTQTASTTRRKTDGDKTEFS